MNKRKKSQTEHAKEHGISQATASRVLGEHGELKRRLDLAMAREREAKASLRELQLEHEQGRYVEQDLVQRDAADTAERVLAVLRAIPQRTAMALECEHQRAAVVEKKIAEEIERSIAELRESKYMGVK